MATIDVLLPVKNGIGFLEKSLASISNQTFKDWRLIVLDHGSMDGSFELASDYSILDPRIEIYSFPEADGLAELLNRGLDLCDCKYVMRHDADDISLPNRMDLVLAAFKDQFDCIAIGGQADLINGAGVFMGKMIMPTGKNRVAAGCLFRNPIAHPAAMLDFYAMQKLGVRYGIDFLKVLIPEKRIEVKCLAEDYLMFGQLSLMGKCTNIPVRLIQYRSHGSNIGATRFHEQMIVSLNISRFLMHCFCAMRNLPYSDPAPFCNLGGSLFDVEGQIDFNAEFEEMANNLRLGFGKSEELERELAFRRVISTRNDACLLWRYYQFQLRNSPETGEWNAVRSWVIRRFPGKSRMSITSELTG